MSRTVKFSEIREASPGMREVALAGIIAEAKVPANGSVKALNAEIAEYEQKYGLDSGQLLKEHPDHADEHHRHEYDWKSGEHLPGSPSWVGPDGWPTLGRFIEEVEQWYWKHKEELPNPEGHGTLDARG